MVDAWKMSCIASIVFCLGHHGVQKEAKLLGGLVRCLSRSRKSRPRRRESRPSEPRQYHGYTWQWDYADCEIYNIYQSRQWNITSPSAQTPLRCGIFRSSYCPWPSRDSEPEENDCLGPGYRLSPFSLRTRVSTPFQGIQGGRSSQARRRIADTREQFESMETP